MNTLSLNNIHITRGNLAVACGIDLECKSGKVYTLLGANGVGKSSLLKAIFGQLPHQGHIRFGTLSPTDRKNWVKHIGYMPQDTHTDAVLSALEVVLLGRMDALHMHVGDELLGEAVAILASLGIAHLAHHNIAELSGGQRQLVMFAQVLLRKPKILLLDEPVSALDMYHQLGLLQRVREYTHDNGLITLMVLHDLSLAGQFSDELILLHAGNIHAQGTPQEVLTQANIQELYRVNAEILSCSHGLPVIRPVCQV